MIKYLLVTLFCMQIGSALPMYNPAQASLLTNGVCCEARPINYCDPWDSMSLNIGFTGSYVLDHQMVSNLRNDKDVIRDFSIRTNASYLALNICEFVELFSTIGASDISVNWPPKAVNKPNSSTKLRMELETAYSLSFGGRATAYQCDNYFFGFEIEYFRTKPSILSIDATPVSQINYKYNEWQISGGGAYLISLGSIDFVPYLGIHYGRTYFSAQQQEVIDPDGDRLMFITLAQQNHVGYTFGTTMIGCQKIQISAEATFISEVAFTFNSSFRF